MNKAVLSLCFIAITFLAGFLLLDSHSSLSVKSGSEASELPDPKTYVCYRASTPVAIDGSIDEQAWKDAPWSDFFVDIEGDKKPMPRLKTRMKMLWTDEGIYVAVDIEEPHLWGNITQHDAVIFQDNDFEMFLDPDSDSHFYGEMEMNILNTTWDLLLTKPYKDGGKAINAWEIEGLKTAVKFNGTINDPSDIDRGWTLEIFWPFKGLRELSSATIPPKDGDLWRVNFSRVEWDLEIKAGKYVKVPSRPEHNWVWSPQGVIDMHRPERWGLLQFSNAKPGTVHAKNDPAQVARDYLHRVYYTQKEHREKQGQYAKDLNSLGAASRFGATSGLTNPTLYSTNLGFLATVELFLPKSQKQKWTIREDGLIRRD